MKKIGVAIIGCGMIAESHALAVLQDSRAELRAAAYGTNRARGEAFAERYNVQLLVGDYHELLKHNDIDMVCICTPSGLHGACAIDFANAGKSILCEKPLDINSQVISQMIKAAEKNQVKFGCVFPNRTRPGLIRAKELLDSGELGKIRIVECQYRGYRSPAYFTGSKWRGTRAYDGGGCLMNQGIHAIDAMVYLAGNVESVCAQTGTLGRDIEVEDTAAALLSFENGAQGVIMGTTLSYMPEGGPEGDRIRIECENGSILYADGVATYYKSKKTDDFDVEKIPLDDVDEEKISSGSRAENIDMGAHSTIVSDFITAILEDGNILVPARSARHCVDVVLSIYASAEKRAWVQVYRD